MPQDIHAGLLEELSILEEMQRYHEYVKIHAQQEEADSVLFEQGWCENRDGYTSLLNAPMAIVVAEMPVRGNGEPAVQVCEVATC